MDKFSHKKLIKKMNLNKNESEDERAGKYGVILEEILITNNKYPSIYRVDF